ncbi:flagellar motor switch protein FliM [Buchnera aphidicola (Rhopalosiphum padi)]|uniref:Flagellar motor switch protein FliM n=1 Tax=Buchnera aphidicola subsp. Rhopalosiphum padi TaxID=98793 RepID=A0A4D6Y4W6_BUCRP|nr:FliM/FliN family flagellar motor switch protein [Buchnera aphidicola]QCI24736.1 flagellar motor switch protein FliM [Buchnera aphidicola (Rhopalosiphum padi)]
MGKSTNLDNKHKIIYKREKNLDEFLTQSEIKKLEKINQKFIKKIIMIFSTFIKSDIELNFHTVKINSYTNDDKNFHYLYSNSLKIKPLEKKSFIFFSPNLLSVFIDFLFGGNGNTINKIDIKKEITYSEDFVNKKIVEFIIDTYCKSCKDFFYIDIKFLNFNIIDLKKNFFSTNNPFITNYFDFNLNGIKVFFSILIPLSIIKQKNKKIITSLDTNISSKNTILKENIFIEHVCEIELDVIVELIISSVPKNKFDNLREGDVLLIENPEKVTAYIEKKPIFSGKHKIFDGKSIIFLENFFN